MAVPASGSLVSNILKKAATLDDAYLEESISKVEKKCAILREEVVQLLKQHYDEFMVQVDSTISIEEKIKNLTTEFQRLSTRVEGDLKGRLVKSIGKKEEIEKQFNETETQIKFVEKLVQVYTNLEHINVCTTRKQYVSASKAIAETTSLLKQIGRDGCEAKVCNSLENQLTLVTSNLKLQLQEDWNMFVKWNPAMPTQELPLATAVGINLTLPNGVAPEFEDLNESMNCIFAEEEMESRGKKFATKLLNGFIKPLLKHQSLEVSVTTDDHFSIISLRDLGMSRSFGSSLTSIANLMCAIHDMMPESRRSGWMSLLGKTIEPDFTPLFLKHVLSEQIPKTGAERTEFSNTSSLVANLQDRLIKLGVVEESYSVFTDYTVNVDTHIAIQQCQDVLDKARKLLLLPIHNTVKTSSEDTLVPLKKLNLGGPFETGEKQSRLTSLPEEIDIGSLTFAFPSCLISESVKQLVMLLLDTLVRCTTSSNNSSSVQLYYTSRDIIELFIAISNAYHQKTVCEIPRNAMVQHNNYMYVAHNLLTVGHQFHSRIKCISDVSFIDYVPRLRRLGEECFLSEMEKQSNSILDCLSSFPSFDEVADRQDELERAIRQSILLIFNLSNVYSETLHSELYRRCQGGLLNVLVAELIARTLKLVDIASADTNALNEAFEAEVVQKAPVALSLMSEDKDILPKICQNWERLKELIFILGASQNGIVNRWDNGKGPLAKQLSVAEVKQLIRAIFKNTERRANTLTKII